MGKRNRSPSEKKIKKPKKRKLIDLDDAELEDDAFTANLFPTSDGIQHDFKDLKLKPSHEMRSIYVCPNRRIYLESFSPCYDQAYDFLIAIAEPKSRLRVMHEYQLTDLSLYAAVSVGLKGKSIIEVLDRLSKTYIPENVIQFINEITETYGKLSLVLCHNRYFLESRDTKFLTGIKNNPLISEAHILTEDCDKHTGFIKSRTSRVAVGVGFTGESKDEIQEDGDDGYDPLEFDSFEIDRESISMVKQECNRMRINVLEEYDFVNDTTNKSIPIDLKPSTTLRPYQEKSLSKMFGNGRARSGIIVLPCGAGKTLVGVTAACTLKKRTLVLTTNSVSVSQWRQQFMMWSTIPSNRIACFTSKDPGTITDDVDIIISTYTMITSTGHRSDEAKKLLGHIKDNEWGLLLLDEVHVTPATTFREVVKICAAHCRLGLTATLVREDNKIDDLNFLVGSKLYEANWLDLSKAGFIATVSCAEVWCDMPNDFFQAWLTSPAAKKRQLSVMNPVKFRICEFLIQYHEARGDKIIVFSDDIFALKHYAETLGKVYMYGHTDDDERNGIFHDFKYPQSKESEILTIFISKIGDNAIDLPEANVLIQISSHYGARKQEAQRLGRILRAKAKTKSEFNAYFYTLISKYTEEMGYSSKRQRFLVNQGYSYKIITEIPEMEQATLHYNTNEEQLKLLSKVMSAACKKDRGENNQTKRKIGNRPGDSRSGNNLFTMNPNANPLPKRNK